MFALQSPSPISLEKTPWKKSLLSPHFRAFPRYFLIDFSRQNFFKGEKVQLQIKESFHLFPSKAVSSAPKSQNCPSLALQWFIHWPLSLPDEICPPLSHFFRHFLTSFPFVVSFQPCLLPDGHFSHPKMGPIHDLAKKSSTRGTAKSQARTIWVNWEALFCG